MKAVHPWHTTAVGRLVLWLGSIRFAVPTMVFVSIALAWGTFIDSTHGARAARESVYGAWWFIALMGLVCVSLIFAVISRFPWQRKHLGFMVVHASLVALIAGGFWSLFGRLEGRIALEQGHMGGTIETDREVLELVEHQAGTFSAVAMVPAPASTGTVTLGELKLRITDRWHNSREDTQVLDGGPQPYRATEIDLDGGTTGVWIGDEAVGGAAKVDNIVIRVLGAGVAWEPPASSEAARRYEFHVGGRHFPLPSVGEEAFPGWTVSEIKEFSHAKVSASGITDAPDAEPNPAIDVVITDNKGTTERHTAFQEFSDINFTKTIEGSAKSGARLAPGIGASSQQTLVIHGEPGNPSATFIDATGDATTASSGGKLPWDFKTPRRTFTILRDFARAHELSRFVESNETGDVRPALVIAAGDAEPQPIAWKSMISVPVNGRNTLVRYGPLSVPLPFSMTLKEFRKTDYPGTEMAMAYESAVTVTGHGGPEFDTVISMNKPLVQSGWKVYQSGFSGQTVSIFSVMRDPGLMLTYIACTGLCIGIIITFYARGHPGIPAPFARKETHHVPFDVVPAPPGPVDLDESRTPVHAGVG